MCYELYSFKLSVNKKTFITQNTECISMMRFNLYFIHGKNGNLQKLQVVVLGL